MRAIAGEVLGSGTGVTLGQRIDEVGAGYRPDVLCCVRVLRVARGGGFGPLTSGCQLPASTV